MASEALLPSVCVVGTGYVGLPLCIALAAHGHRVLGVDIQEEVVDAINNGEFPFEEPAMGAAFRQPGVHENLRASGTPAPADIFVITVPTPVDRRKRVADLSYLEAALESIGPHLREGNLVIVESTVPPLTCREVVTPLLERHGHRVGRNVLLAHCPERVLPGDIMREIVHNDRIIGGTTSEAAHRALAMYASFVRGALLETDDVTAELCKLMENTYRDVNVALANEFAAVSETLGVDVVRAIHLSNRHPRVSILEPGIGAGGHCIPVDPWFIRQVDPENARLIDVARRVNSEVPSRIAGKIRHAVASVPRARIAAVGVSYKPNTADPRESPALEIVASLQADGYDVTAYDPLVEGYPWPDRGLTELAGGCDCLVILVEHAIVREQLNQFRTEIEQAMRRACILRFYQPADDRSGAGEAGAVARRQVGAAGPEAP